jgi:methyltransferase (TIGR00027 family)
MLDDVPSRTALATTFIRAAHLHLDDPPAVLEDTVAFELLPAYQRRYIKRLAALAPDWLRRYRSRFNAFTAMRAQIVVRARYAEDALSAPGEPIGRYVVLAAGLDTYAARQVPPQVDVLEIDHPATQRWKRRLFAERHIEVSPRLSFLPIDFEATALDEVWPASPGADFISWLGCTYYLTRETVAGTLKTLAARTRAGSRLVLDYWCEPPPTDASSPLLWGTRIAVALQREPFRSLFPPGEIAALAESAGWRVRENLTPAQQNTLYLDHRRDGLAVPSFAYLLHLEH